uniref:Solute carrier family 35 member F2 n=1 Tax=Periophthalmus magnuspinnatus TaxID=409849 RepID=A0A3B4A3I3_9GOBI
CFSQSPAGDGGAHGAQTVWEVHTRLGRLLKTIAMGQVLSLLICGTAVSCQYLADEKVETPMLQSFLNYTLLLLVYTTFLGTRRGDKNLFHVLRSNWWKYLVMGLADVEANYTVVKAYQFTTLTSIQLLDCFVIPVLMLLSWFLLKTRYRPVHFVAVLVCLLGVGAMVGADILAGRDQGSTEDVLLGDGLVLLSAALYAVSNVCQEHTVKTLSTVEFLGMMGLFGTVISGIQLAPVRAVCPLHVCSVQLHACGGKADQCHSGQPVLAHRRPLQPLLWTLPLPLHGQ